MIGDTVNGDEGQYDFAAIFGWEQPKCEGILSHPLRNIAIPYPLCILQGGNPANVTRRYTGEHVFRVPGGVARRMMLMLSDSRPLYMNGASCSTTKEALLRFVQTGERTLPEVINKLGQAQVDEASAKAAVLRLAAEGLIEITSDWKIRRLSQAAEAK